MKNIGYRILNFPLTRIVIGFVFVVGLFNLSQAFLSKVLYQTPLGREFFYLCIGIVPAALAVLSYLFLYRFYEKRKVTELSVNRIGRDLALGVLLGAVLQSLTIGVIYLKGGFVVESVNSFLFVIPGLTMAFSTAVLEELLLRGIVFRIMEEKLGSYLALALSALLFGLMHLANPHSSFVASLGIAIQAGLLLGIAYIYTRKLWFPIAIHFAWNFTQAGIFGANVSGGSLSKSLLNTKITGAEWFTGGAFGPEGSVQATLFCLCASLVLFVLCRKYNKMIKPFWIRNQQRLIKA
ncbi:CPBP family intramembrane metalloprotease [Ancylomarina salipaludis]|uniref:CPBP family intramembrane metalloprotease n=1 Tax=Ancylomarina salipaludis TaxID=2501299 RepID=A0A4Q1JMQ6_9BACT|nr:type II CAAX endopeptidase family protein [Ancylomarina salipaludis]RXQ95822.1 CPBP family intramembrane metalloprotease [Ancylomarina salipaludis]